MGYNRGIQENILTICFTLGTILFTVIAFIGAGDFAGFLNEVEVEQTFSLGIFDFVAQYSIRRFLHLSIIPTIFGIVIGAFERIPRAGNKIKVRTFKPLNLSAITFFNYFIQLTPTIIGMHNFDGDLISATWFSDWVMVPYGYAGLAFAFVVSIGTGFYYVTAYWIHNQQDSRLFQEFVISFMIIIFSIIAFVGFGAFDGFLALYKVSSFDEYVYKYGFINLFYQGPVKNYSHLIVLPSLIGLMVLVWERRPGVFKIREKAKAKKLRKQGRIKIQKPKKLGLIALSLIMVQLVPVILGLSISPTWLSDLIMNKLYGYLIMSVSVIFGIIYGLYRAITGSVLHQH